MALGRRRGDGETGVIRTTALVIEAEAPPQGGKRLSKIGESTIRLLVDAGSGPVLLARSSHLKKDQWLVAGMEVPVAIDPGRPDDFELDWDAIPGIEERAAADDPALADPIATRRRVFDALRSAGIAGPDQSLPAWVREMAAEAGRAGGDASPHRFEEAMENASQQPAPAGKVRAVVLISTIRARIVPSGPDGGGPSRRVTDGNCNAVLAVSVPGRSPYAVYEKKFKRPRGRGDVVGAGLPAVVSSTDPSDVEVLWDELPSLGSQVEQRISDSMERSQASSGEIERQMAERIQQASAQPPPAATTAPGAAPGGQLSPQMREMMASNAKMALQATQDPAVRKMLIEQYRLAGIPIDEDGNPA